MVLASVISSSHHKISLEGQWEFALDPQGLGVGQAWFADSLKECIQLPASWAEAGFGDPPQSHFLAGWNPVCVYEGAAWYSRLLDVPAEWDGRQVELVLKGVRWRSS